MEWINIGRIVTTHGIKGELRILSNFEKKTQVFHPGFKLYFGKNFEEVIIKSFRYHKIYDMVTLEGYDNINQVLKYKGMDVFIKRSDLTLKLDEYLLADLVGLRIVDNDKFIGKCVSIVYNSSNILMKIEGDKNFYIPLNGGFIKNVDLKKGVITTEGTGDLIL